MNEIIKWLQDYANKSGLKTFVIGISGGIDSAVTSTLCAQTGLNIIVVSLPIHQQTSELKRARNHIEWLKNKYKNVSSIEINLTHVFDSFEMLFADNPNKLALSNSRARLRMTTLYQIAQTNKGLVVGTGNKVEDFGVGFFTKYGDGGVDISPIGDLLKSDVTTLAIELQINKEIVDAPPTDGLWGDDRTDEDQLGATYDELEWAMGYRQYGKHISFESLTPKEQKMVKIYDNLHKQNKHKMDPIPVFNKN